MPWIRHGVYELSTNLHVVVGIFAIVALWIHFRDRYSINGYLLIGSLGSLVIITLFHVVYQVFRNRLNGRSLAIAEKEKLEGAVRLSLTPTRPWRVRAG